MRDGVVIERRTTLSFFRRVCRSHLGIVAVARHVGTFTSRAVYSRRFRPWEVGAPLFEDAAELSSREGCILSRRPGNTTSGEVRGQRNVSKVSLALGATAGSIAEGGPFDFFVPLAQLQALLAKLDVV